MLYHFGKQINELVDECFQMDINMLSSRRNIINNPWISIGIITSIKTKDHYYLTIMNGENQSRN